jgi:hypothetical protein
MARSSRSTRDDIDVLQIVSETAVDECLHIFRLASARVVKTVSERSIEYRASSPTQSPQ